MVRVTCIRYQPDARARDVSRYRYVNIHRQVKLLTFARSTLAYASGWYGNRNLTDAVITAERDDYNPEQLCTVAIFLIRVDSLNKQAISWALLMSSTRQ